MKRAAVILLLLLPFAACTNNHLPSAEPRQTVQDLILHQNVAGSPHWMLKAPSAIIHEESSQAVLSEPRLEFYKNGHITSKVHSRIATVQTDTQDVLMSSSVVVVSLEDSSTLQTELLLYSSARQLFVTDAPVTLRRPSGIARGRGLEAKPDLSEIRIFHQQSVVTEVPRE